MTLKSVLITGGTGFLGAAIARAVSTKYRDCRLVVLDSKPPGDAHAVPNNALYIAADITSESDVVKAVAETKPQVIIHSAGMVGKLNLRYGRKEAKQIWNVNVTGTRNVIKAAKEAKAKAIVYTSSCAAVTDDLNSQFPNVDESWPTCHSSLPYGESKVIGLQIRTQ